MSNNIIDSIQLSGVTYQIQGSGGGITIDPTLDSGSTNPVANSAITTALDAKVNVTDNIVSAATITFAYDKGDTYNKYPYNNGLIINEFYVKPVNQYTYTNIAAWNFINISNGDSYTEIKVSVDCSNYKITAVTSTSGENFTYAIEDGVLHVTLSEGYFIQTISQNQDFQISYEKYTIESGQTADVINEDLIDVIQDIYDQVPKAYLSAVIPMLDSTRLTILNTKSDGSNSGKFISFGSSIKGDNNKMDVYLPSRYITNVTLNTGNSNYCQVPSSTVNDYNTGFAYMDLAVNTGYTGSSTSFTFTVKTLFSNNSVQTDTFTYDVANKTIGGNQLYISVYCYDNTITINPKQYNFSRIQSVSVSNCKICGVDSPSYFKNQYIITGVTAASYTKQANTVINEIYSELNSKATTTYVNQSTSGKVDTSVYTAYTAATDTALAGKQTTLTAGTGISIVDNVISATGGGGGNPTVELTQAEYDALVTAGTVSDDTYYIITDAQAGDLTNYYTKSETDNLVTAATSTKQDTLVSSQNIKTINNESLLGSGNIDIQGGSTYTAGRGISITTGETADTVSFDLPIYKTVSGTAFSLVLNTSLEPSANIFKTKYNTYINCIKPYVDNNSGARNLIMGEACSAMSYASESFVGGFHTKIGDSRTFAFGAYSEALATGAVAFGYDGKSFKPQVSKGQGSFACGGGTSANTKFSFATGYHTFTTTISEFASGQYNNSVSATTTFGDSGNTLFSVGNGTADNARHNAFEIRQNGDIYLTKDGQDVKLQDQLGGGGSSYTAGDGIDITNDVISVTGKVDTTTYNTFTAATDTALASKQTTLTAGTNITIIDNVISAEGGGLTEDDELLLSTALVDLNERKIDASEVKSNYQKKGDYVTTSTLNTRLAEYETALDEQNVEEVTAYALNDLNERFGGLKIAKITESEYEALTTKDENVLYIVVADPT